MANVSNLGVMAGLAMVSVPVVTHLAKKEVSEASKKARKEAKRAVYRSRKAIQERYTSDATARLALYERGVSSLFEAYGCRGVSDRTGAPVIRPGMAFTLDNYVDGGDPIRVEAVSVTDITVNGGSRVIVPMPTHTFRRKVSAGETQEQFVARLERAKLRFFQLGYSLLDKACHCNHCRGSRINSWSEFNRPGNQVGTRVASLMRGWDEVNNPFAENYRYRNENRQRRDEDGNVLPRNGRRMLRWPGAGIGGETFSDAKAKGGASRLVGLEVEHNREISGTHLWAEHWSGAQVIGDGSCGREAVTPPLAGEHIRKCLTELCDALNKGNAGCDSRCGLHVHVDARDMRWADMLRFLTVYCRIESLLFLIGGQNRYSKPGSGGNGYCFPVAELYGKALRSTDPKGAILAAAVLGDRAPEEGRTMMKDNPPGKKGQGRYKSINIMPWIAGRAYDRKDTTVEFRLHRGSHNAERIITWAHICQDIVHWCINATNADVDNLPKSAARALIHMSPRNKAWIIKRILGWRKSTTASKTPLEDDVGNYKPRRIVTMKGGLYLVDASRCSYRRD